LEHLDEKCRYASTTNQAHKKYVKATYDKSVHPKIFSEGDLVLVNDQEKVSLGEGKFNPLWHDPFIVRRALWKGEYELVDFKGNALPKTRNGIYLKKYYT
jgi:hypothetical protein